MTKKRERSNFLLLLLLFPPLPAAILQWEKKRKTTEGEGVTWANSYVDILVDRQFGEFFNRLSFGRFLFFTFRRYHSSHVSETKIQPSHLGDTKTVEAASWARTNFFDRFSQKKAFLSFKS